MIRLRTGTTRECRKTLSKIANMTVNNEMSCKEASTLTYIVNSILGAIRQDELEIRQGELERLLLEKEKGNADITTD